MTRGLFVQAATLSDPDLIEMVSHAETHAEIDRLVLHSWNEGDAQTIREYWGGKLYIGNPEPESYHYARILDQGWRWANLAAAEQAANAAKSYADGWYITLETGLNLLAYQNYQAAWEAYLIEMVKRLRAVKDVPIIWSPYVTGLFDPAVVVGYRKTMEAVLRWSPEAQFELHLQDGVGARIQTKESAKVWAIALMASTVAVDFKMNVEWFTIDGYQPRVPDEAFYGIEVGACWELRYWYRAHSDLTIPKIVYLTRAEWGARTDLPRLGYYVAPAKRTEVHVHHTATVDTYDPGVWTRNRWDLGEAIAYQRRLQTARPDLGKDIPYNLVSFVSEDAKTVWVMEGRGLYRSGAHTAGHNTAGFGWAVGGNFDLPDPEAAKAFIFEVDNRLTYLRRNGFFNLGSARSPKGWWVWGHRDSAPKACPGSTLYPMLASVAP
jgi:hypothetical protein